MNCSDFALASSTASSTPSVRTTHTPRSQRSKRFLALIFSLSASCARVHRRSCGVGRRRVGADAEPGEGHRWPWDGSRSDPKSQAVGFCGGPTSFTFTNCDLSQTTRSFHQFRYTVVLDECPQHRTQRTPREFAAPQTSEGSQQTTSAWRVVAGPGAGPTF